MEQVVDCGLNQGKSKKPEYIVACDHGQCGDGSLVF